MRKILLLGYHYPPIGGAAVMRNARLARFLPDCGYEPIVITGPGEDSGFRWTPRDDELGAGVPLDVPVHRLASPEPPRDSVWRGRSARWLRVRMPWERWWRDGALALARAVGHDVDLLHASVAPYETAETAVEIAAVLRKPLVLDFEDPWALDEMLVYPTAAHRALDRRAMSEALSAADAIVMNTPEARQRVLGAFPALRKKRVVCVPNGYDEDDFPARAAPSRGDGAFRIVHTGSLHTDMGLRQREASPLRRALGGMVDGVDFLTRSHVFLLRAVDELAAERPDIVASLEVHLAGVLTPADLEIGRRSPYVRVQGFVPHAQTIAVLRSADLLFLPMHDLPPGRRIGIVPCKTYEYIASGRPILAAVPEGDARDLLLEVGTARVCRPGDVEAMKTIIAEEVDRWAVGKATPEPRYDLQHRYGFRALTAQLARLYDDLLGSTASAAAAV